MSVPDVERIQKDVQPTWRAHRGSGPNRNKLEIRKQISSVATNVIKYFERKYGGHFESRGPPIGQSTPRHSYVAVHARK